MAARRVSGVACFAMAVIAAIGPRATAQTRVPPGPPPLWAGLGTYHRPIWSTSPEAQRYFDQGLTLVYAFNHQEAVRSFRRAAELDARAPMPLWGVAYALGPNINDSAAGEARARAAFETVERARILAAAAPERERAWVEALARRYAPPPTADRHALAVSYRDAMAALSARYPEDLDAATLYAEAIMDVRPWQLWSSAGAPAPGTEEMIAVLESVLRRDPLHPGANHYYIHALEASPFPERALDSAKRLETLVPGAGHLVHMPSHIYMRTGDYQGAEASNAAAARVDEAYIASAGVTGLYPLAYYAHNLRFLAAAAGMQGRLAEARSAADRLVRYVVPIVAQVPMAEMLLPTRACVLARFAKWSEILELSEPPAAQPVSRAFHSYVRAVALAEVGDVAKAIEERARFAAARRVPDGMMIGNNTSDALFEVAARVIDARIAAARGDRAGAIDAWRSAVAAEDALAYGEPPDWYYPVRESLGAALLLDGQAREAQGVFQEDLRRNPGNGRSLFGLWQALAALDRATEAARAHEAFSHAWKNADVVFRITDL